MNLFNTSLKAAVLGCCAFMFGLQSWGQYDLTIEQSAPAAAPGTVYRFYVEANDPSDKISAVFGNDQMPLVFSTPDGVFNSALNSAWNASGINSALFGFFPDLQDDSFATIGLDGPAAMVPGAEDPSLVQDASLPTTVSGYFQAGGTELNVNTLTGASWYVLNTAANALPSDGRWLVAQITTAGDLSGTLNAQIFPLGVGADQIQQSWDFAGGEVIIPCDGVLDECGVCDGPGIPEGACDCAGTMPAFARDCDGNCILDADGDGICDDEDACVPAAAEMTDDEYKLTVEAYNVGALGTTYRFYVNASDATDKISAVFGNDQSPLVINTPDGIYNDAFNTSWNASGINAALFGFFPDLEYDSYATIGLEGPAAGVAGAEDPSLVQDASLTPSVSGYFQAGGTGLNVNTLTGASWYVLNTAANALPTDGRWLIAQITTAGSISGTINYQIFPLGDGANQIQKSVDFDGEGEFPLFVTVCGCMDDSACNFNAEANNEDGSCEYAADNYDCDGNCLNDADGDGVCDELEIVGCQDDMACNYDMTATDAGSCEYAEEGFDCDGNCVIGEDCNGVCGGSAVIDECGVCGGSGIAEGECDCDGNVLDACGVCGGTGVLGCADESASNYNELACADDGSCLYATTFNVDMNCPFNPGALLNGSTEINDLFVTGPLLGWAANEGYNQLTDEDGDNIFSVTLDFPAGDIEYKYAVNGFADQENLIDDMQNGADCAPVTDYAGYANRLVAAGSSTNDIFGSCTICSEQVVDVTFSVDVSNESFDYVTIAGTFNGWNNGANPMNDDDGDGIYTITLQFPPNSAQEYKFLGNGDWGIAELFDGSESCTTGPGEYINRVVQVPGESIVLDTVCYNLCEACAPGCTNDTACNYDDSANVDNGSCEYVAATELPNCGDDAGEGAELGLFFSGYAEGSSNNKFMEIYNPTGDVVSLDGYAFPNVSNAPNVPGEYEYWNAFPAGASIAPGDVYVIAHPSADPAILAEADHTFTFLSNGDDGFILVMGSEEDFVQIDAIGDWNGDPGSGWPVAGVSNGTKDHSLIRKADVTSGNGGDWTASAGTNEEDSEWIVLDQNDWTGLGSHDFAGAGGPTFAVIYDCDGNCLNDANGDGLCDELTVMGCTDESACNYNDCANLDDGSCDVPDADCEECVDGASAAIDTDGDGVADCEEIAGCQDDMACNYNELATDAAASGLMISLTSGSWASEISWTLNGEEYGAPFEGFIALEEGSYTIAGFDSYGDGWNGAEMTILDPNTGASSSFAVTGSEGSIEVMVAAAGCVYADGNCEYCNDLGGVSVADEDGDGVCDQDEIAGCQDETADNYNADATDPAAEPGLIISLNAGSWPSEIDWTVGDAAGGAPFEGFVALAEGSYTLSGTDSYGDGWNGAVMTIVDAISGTEYSFAVEGSEGSVEVMVTGNADACYYLGCMDADACNYDATATVDDGSCDVPNLECQECIDGASVDIDTDGDGVIDCEEVEGCMDSAACNYSADATDDDGSCDVPDLNCQECIDGASVDIDTDGDGVRDCDEIVGCQDAAADNYDASATDAGDCLYTGCMDDSLNSLGGFNACNYDPIYNVEGECEYPEASEFISIVDGEAVVELVIAYDCDGNALPEYDLDGNGVPDALEAQGCTDPAAANYNADANVDDGSCLYAGCIYMAACNYDMNADIDNGSCVFDCLLIGCTDAGAVNYDSAATIEDGSCLFPGCQDEEGLNYDASANYPGECIYLEPCPGDFTGDGEVDVNDLLDFFQLWGNECPWIPGFED